MLGGDRAGWRRVERISAGTEPIILVIGNARTLAVADGNQTVVAIHLAKPTDPRGDCLEAYDIATGRPLYRRTGEGIGETQAASPIDGGLIATPTRKTLQVREPSGGDVVASLGAHANDVLAAAFSADGTRLVSGDAAGCVFLRNVRARRRLAILDGLGGRVQSVAVIPGSTDVLLGLSDGLVLIWHSKPMDPSPTTVRHAGEVWDVAYSPDG